MAVTAASPEEDIWATFCPPEDTVAAEDDREAKTCLGDAFSVAWITNALRIAFTEETMREQIKILVNNSKSVIRWPSTVCVYGDDTIQDEKVA